MQFPPLFGLGFAKLARPDQRRAPPNRSRADAAGPAGRCGSGVEGGGALAWWLGAGVLLGTALSGCGTAAQQGDCGPFLSSAECQVVRVQLGTLDRRPPPDPTNRFGRCVNDGSAECILEDAAVALGHRLFFDRCLSVGNNVGCVTCHQPGQAFTDDRTRDLLTPPTKFMVGGVEKTLSLPLIVNPTPERVTMPPPAVQAQVDDQGNPLARWNSEKNTWEAIKRRPLASFGSAASNAAPPATARHSPTLYNIAYGGGFAPAHGERTYGVTWTPWDGRYDSAWALVADVLEFGGTQNTDRSHVAVRIGQKHRQTYEQMIGGPLFDFDVKQLASDGTLKYVYPRHASPGGACWYSGNESDCSGSLAPTAVVRSNINEVFVNAGKALGAYMRRLRSAGSPYDRWLAGDQEAMSGAAQRGLRLFIGKAECIMCHNGPNFTDWRFHNLGIPENDPERRTAGSVSTAAPDNTTACFDGMGPSTICADPGRYGWQQRVAGQCPQDRSSGTPVVRCQPVDQPASTGHDDVAMDCRSSASDATDKDTQCQPASLVDAAKCAYTNQAACDADALCQWSSVMLPSGTVTPRCVARVTPAELGQFKTPSLRNVGLTFPYMHNGMLSNYGPAERGETSYDDPTPHLTRVVEFYDGGGGRPNVGTLDPQIHPLHLSATEVADLVEFLKALTDNSMATASDPLTLPPPDLIDTSQDCPP